MNGTNHVGENATRWQYLKCSGGDSTADPDVRFLQENVKGCDWEMQLIFEGNDCMPVSNIYLKGLH
jgi:hypothetical protein